jgi:hypothetical protein
MPAETSVSQSAVYRARPTLRLAGQEDLRVSELLIGMRIEESEGGMSTAELRFSNWASTTDGGAEYAFEDGSRLALGTAIEVYAGDETQARELFRGVVSGFEAEFAQGSPPELVVLAEDPLGRARMARRSKVYSDMSPADVVNAVANELGLRPSVQGLSRLRLAPGRNSTRAISLSCGGCSAVSTAICRSSATSCRWRLAATCGAANCTSNCTANWRARGWWPIWRSR